MKLLLLAISKKYGGLCVAGINYETLEYVRIGHACGNDCKAINPNELNVGGHQCQILDVIDIDANKMPVNGCHIENYDLKRIKSYIKTIDINELDSIYNDIRHPRYAFYDNNYKIRPADIIEVNKSLLLLKVTDLNIYMATNGKQHDAPYAAFNYNNIRYIGLSVTDSLVCAYPHPYILYDERGIKFNAHLGRHKVAYIMVSLPYDEWSLNNGFFKYVSGVIV